MSSENSTKRAVEKTVTDHLSDTKLSDDGIVLLPQPSNDERDPLVRSVTLFSLQLLMNLRIGLCEENRKLWLSCSSPYSRAFLPLSVANLTSSSRPLYTRKRQYRSHTSTLPRPQALRRVAIFGGHYPTDLGAVLSSSGPCLASLQRRYGGP